MNPEAATAFAGQLAEAPQEALIPAGLASLSTLCPQWQNTGLLEIDTVSGTVKLVARHGPVNALFEGLPTRWPLGISPARALLGNGATQFIADMRESEAFPLYRLDAGVQGYRSVAMLLLDRQGTSARVVSCHANELLDERAAGLAWLELATAILRLALHGTVTEQHIVASPPLSPLVKSLNAVGRSELAETARSFARNEGRYQQTATELSIHVSTLRYRLDRLRDHHGIDVTDPAVRQALRPA